MSTYAIVHTGTGEIVREVTSEQLQAANKLLLATSSRLGLHQAASNSANRRDFDQRYGNNKKHPVGVVKGRSVGRTVIYIFKLLGF